jgi:hypothetical protein
VHRSRLVARPGVDLDLRCFFLHTLGLRVQQHVNSVLLQDARYFAGNVGVFPAE